MTEIATNTNTGNNQTASTDNSSSQSQGEVNTNQQVNPSQGTETNVQNPIGSQEQQVWKPEDGFYKHPDWVKRETKYKEALTAKEQYEQRVKELEAQVSQKPQTQEAKPTETDSTKTNTTDIHPLLRGIDPFKSKDLTVDEKTGEVIDSGYETTQDFANDFVKYLADAIPKMLENDTQIKQEAEGAKEQRFTKFIDAVEGDIGGTGAHEFLDWYEKQANKGVKIPIGEAYTIFKENIYKPKTIDTTLNKEGASKISVPNGSSIPSSMNYRDSSLTDIVKNSIK